MKTPALAIRGGFAYRRVMPSVVVGNTAVYYEAPEAGRYHAPLLVLPGLFQSFEAWRGVTSSLAHRGWEVYWLGRTMPDLEGTVVTADEGWAEARTKVWNLGKRLGESVIVLGCDVGAALALSLAGELDILAMAMFSPAKPAALGAAYRKTLGFTGRMRHSRAASALGPPRSLGAIAPAPEHVAPEPHRLIDELMSDAWAATFAPTSTRASGSAAGSAAGSAGGSAADSAAGSAAGSAAAPAFTPPATRPPAIVFAADGDPLVDAEHALTFAQSELAKVSLHRLDGHWWPASDGQAVADEVHRFIILTLGDRVVDFPEEIFAEE